MFSIFTYKTFFIQHKVHKIRKNLKKISKSSSKQLSRNSSRQSRNTSRISSSINSIDMDVVCPQLKNISKSLMKITGDIKVSLNSKNISVWYGILTIFTRDHFPPDQIPLTHNSHPSFYFSLFFLYFFIFLLDRGLKINGARTKFNR